MKYLKRIILTVLATALHFAFSQSRHYLLILSKGEHKMLVLDYKTLDSITVVPVGEDPHEIELSTDQSTAYVSNAVIAGTGHIINIIDLKSLKPVRDIDTRPFYVPHGMAYRNDSLWFTAQGSKCVVVYDLKQQKPVEVIGTGQDFTHLIYLTPDGNTFYTTNVESGTISIYERRLLSPYIPPTGVLPPGAKQRLEWRQTLINVGYGCEGFDVTADGKQLWTALPNGKIVVVDLEKKSIKTQIDTHVEGLHRVALTADGKTLCAVSVKTGDLLFYNTQTLKPEQRLKTGMGAGLYMDKAGDRLFVSCTPNNYVDVIDLKTRTEIKRIAVGRPDGITSAMVK